MRLYRLRSRIWITPVFLMAAGLCFASVEDTVRVEGVLFDPQNSQESFAVINGALFKEGSEYENFKIEKILSDKVRILDTETGEEHDLAVLGNLVPVPEPSPAETDEETPEGTNPFAAFFDSIHEWILTVTRVNEIALIADLKNIHVAGTACFLQNNDTSQLTLQQLVNRKMLSRDFEDGIKAGYRFRMEAIGHGIRIYADPEDPKSKRRHFMIDDDGTLYVEKDKPATPESTLYNP